MSKNYSLTGARTSCLRPSLKFVLGLVFLFASALSTFAQVSAYSRSTLTGTYTQLSTGTVINTTAGLSASMGNSADDGAALVTLPFTFTYNGTAYTQVTMCTNGWIGFGSQLTVTSTQGRTTGNTWTNTAPNNIVAAWFRDGSANFPGPGVGSMRHGSTGTDIYVFQWDQALTTGFTQAATPTISYQIALYGPASTNPGRIEILYGPTVGTAPASFGSIAIAGTGTDYVNGTNGLTNSTASPTAWPGNGNGYRFDPPVACQSVSLVGGTTTSTASSACPAVNFTLNVTGSTSGATGLTYQWYDDVDGNTVFTAISGATAATLVTNTSVSNSYRRETICLANATSAFSTPVSVSVVAPSSVPYTEGFESLTAYGAGVFPNCASSQIVTGTNFTSAGATIRNGIGARTGTDYAWAQWSSNTVLYTAGVSLVSGESYDFSYWFANTDAIAGFTLTNKVGTSAAYASMTTLGTVVDPINTSFVEVKYTYVAPSTGTYYFAIQSNSPTSNPWYLCFDDISVVETPACVAPSALSATATPTGATLGWTEGGTATAWNIEFGVAGFTPTSTATHTATGTPTVSVSSLSSNTAYEFYVQADCGGSQSSWTGPYSFSTPCDVMTLPFTENFELASSTLACWSTNDNNSDGALDWTGALQFAWTFEDDGTGNYTASIYTDGNGGANDDYLISPALPLTGNEQVKYDISTFSAGEPSDYELVLSTTGTDPADFSTVVLPLTSVSNTAASQIIVDLSAYTGTVYLAWHLPAGGLDGWYLFVDNVTVEEIPACPPPTAGVASNVTGSSADFSWTAGGAETAWDIEWGTDGFVLGTGTQQLGLTSAAASVTTFSSGTAYDVYYRADCGGGDLSAWVGPINVLTSPGCGDVFRDPGGLGNYPDNSNVTTTIYPSSPGDIVTATFTSFAVETCCDDLTIYNGPNTSSPLIGVYTSSPGVITSSDPSGALTFVFYSDVSSNFSGFEANITCSPAPTCGNPSVSAVVPVYNGVSFTINASGIGTPAGYFYEIVGDGVTPTGLGTSSGSSVSATGLTALTAYDLYVQTDCGLDGLSSWVGPIDFTTPGAPPANDDCAGAISISCASTPVSGTTLNSTVDASYINAGAGGTNTTERGVWYTIAGDDNEYTITTCDPTVGYDSRISVYSGSCGALTPITGNDDMTPACASASFRSEVTFNAFSGTTYYVFVHGYQSGTGLSTTGNFNLNITCAALCLPVPTNEDCASATVLTGDATCVNTAGDNGCAAASAVANPGSFSAFATLNDVWYVFTPDYADNFITITLGTATSMGFSFYTGTCGALVEGYSTAAVTSGTPLAITGFPVGVPIYIRVLSSSANAGSFDICMTEVPCDTPTDAVATATSSTSVDVVITGTAGDYIIEYGAPGFTPGTAGTAGVGGTIVTTSTLTTSVPVAADANYDFYVRKDCSGAGDGYSFQTYAGTVSTFTVVPFSGTASLTTCSATVYDHAGNADYSANANGTLVIYPGNPSGILSLNGTYSTEEDYDYLTFYEGVGTGGTLLADYTGAGTVSVVASAPNTPITVVFTSDVSFNDSGFQFTASCQEVCTDLPVAAALTGNASVCPDESVDISLATPEVGLTYIWQKRTTVGGTWITIPGQTSATLTATQTVNTEYRARLGCVYYDGGMATVPTQSWFVTMNSYQTCYCTAIGETGFGTNISNVTSGGIDQDSPITGGADYTQYAPGAGTTTTYLRGGQYPIDITTGDEDNDYVAAWIDYNHSGSFELSERLTLSGSLLAGETHSASFTVPNSAILGTTTMRVRIGWGTTGASMDACTDLSGFIGGETEDYTVTIAAGASNDAIANATVVSPPVYPACLNLSGNLSLATDDPSDLTSSGADLWYTFTAASNACRIAVSGGTATNTQVEIEAAGGVTMGSVEDATTANGNEIFIFDGLSIGTQYWVAVRNGAGGFPGTFSVCIQSLAASTCDNGPSFPSLCSSFKADWTGTSSYTATFTSQDVPGNVYTYTTSNSSWIPLSIVPATLGNVDAGGLQYGESYTVAISANYNLPDAAGVIQNAVASPASSTCSINIAPVAGLNMGAAYNSVSSGTLVTPGSNPRVQGSWIQTDFYVCGASSYLWSISEVNYLNGTVQVGPAFQATTTSRQMRLWPTNIPNLAAGKRYQILVAPVFPWGPGAFNVATQRYVQIAGSAGMVEENINEEIVLVDKSLQSGVFASLYPNPSNGEMVNINIAGIESESVNIRIMDASGRTVWSNNFFVEGILATTVNFDRPLAAGIYMVEMNYNGEISTQRMVVQK